MARRGGQQRALAGAQPADTATVGLITRGPRAPQRLPLDLLAFLGSPSRHRVSWPRSERAGHHVLISCFSCQRRSRSCRPRRAWPPPSVGAVLSDHAEYCLPPARLSAARTPRAAPGHRAPDREWHRVTLLNFCLAAEAMRTPLHSGT